MNFKKNVIIPLLLLVVLPNLFFLSAAEYFHLGRSPINLDYLFAAVLVTSSLPSLGYILFIIFFLIDFLALVSQIFQFVRLDNLFYLSAFIFEAPIAYQAAAAISTLVVLIFLYCVLCIKKHISATTTLVCFNIAIGFYAISFYSSSNTIEEQRVWRVENPPLIGSPSFYTWRLRSGLFFQQVYDDGQAFMQEPVSGATSYFIEALEQEKYDKILLIVNESWGVAKDKAINQKLISPLKQLDEKIENYSEGSFNFSGATVAGELRELCNLAPLHFNLKDVTEGFQGCLPNKLSQRGYETTAFHAASGVLYDRIYWYKNAGFYQNYFFEHLDWERRCYSYPGGCDFEMIYDVAKALNEPGKQFVYWLTLNSHAIYDQRDLVLDLFDCPQFKIAPDSQSCRNFKLQAQFFSYLSKVIETDILTKTLVIVVSDHPAVISDQKEKHEYFIDNKVNWLSFVVKGGTVQKVTQTN